MSDSQVTTLDDAPAVVVPTKPAKGSKAAAAPATTDGEFFMVTVHATGDDVGSNAVEMGVNGYLYQIPRGVPCRVPKAVVEGLTNAVITTYKVVGADVVERDIQRFPFTAVPA
jgi:hypothetical protein